MAKFQFLGHVLPAARNVSFSGLRPMKVKDHNSDLDVDMTFAITNGKITVECEVLSDLKSFKKSQLIGTYSMARRVSHIVTDLLAFSNGVHVSVSLDTFVDSKGVAKPIVFQIPELAQHITSIRKNGANVTAIGQAIVNDPSIVIALRDLVSSLDDTQLGPVNCARAVDTICVLIAGPGHSAAQWDKLHSTLSLSKGYARIISDKSKGPRHGDWSEQLSNIDLDEIYKRSWVIMNRYIEYILGGRHPLSPPQFPLLYSHASIIALHTPTASSP